MAEFSTSYKSGAFTLRIVWSENTISVENNTSKVTATAYLDMTSGASLSIGSRNNTFTINGTNYAFTSSAISKSSGSAKTVNLGSVTSSAISHGSDGSKSVTIKCTFNIAATLGGTYYASFTASQSVALTKIARLSSLSASNGTLGTSQDLTVTQQNSAYTHTITYACGSASGTVISKSSSVTIPFTPPLSLASQNTTGTSVSIEFTITTYNGNTSLGSSKKTITCSIPSSVKPEVSMSIIDPTGYLSTYDTAIKGKSTLQITLSVTLGGSSPINSYSITANGETYTTSSAVTSVLKTSGTMTVTAKVTDKRGRTDTATAEIEVLDYNAPSITSLSVRRCNQNGTENDQGAYIKVTFSGSVTPLNDNNSARWSIQYKPTSTQLYSTVSIPTLDDHYSVSGYEYIFAADTGNSYDVRVHVQDDFEELYRTTAASTALTIMHFKANGKGMGIGKISELDNVLDIGFQTRFYGGMKYTELASGTNLDDLTIPNFYVCTSTNAASILNCPVSGNSFRLEVQALGNSLSGGNIIQIKQIVSVASGSNPIVYERVRSSSSTGWQNWQPFNPRGSFAYVTGQTSDAEGYTAQTIQGNTWETISLKRIYSSNNTGNNLYPFTIDSSDGTITCNFKGVIALSGAIRAASGMKANDRLAVRITRTRVVNGTSTTDGYGGVWENVCHADGRQTDAWTPMILAIVEPGDKFNLQVRNQDHTGATLTLPDCTLTAFYI